jgi:hypothetical protein
MTVRFSSHVLERYIAPGVGTFTSADIPDMSDHDPESTHWVANHFLNSILRAGYHLPVGAHIQHYLRRSEAAFAEHARAREATLSFLETGGQSPTAYSRALLHWEYFLGQSWHAHLLLRQVARLLSDDDTLNVYEPDDGSVGQRHNRLYNAMKHVESRIDAGQIPENATSPVWLSNRGLECTDGHLTFDETAAILRFLAKWADLFVDAKEVANKVKALNNESPFP